MRPPFTNRRRLLRQLAVGLTIAAVAAPGANAFRAGHGASGEGSTRLATEVEARGFLAIYGDMLRPTAAQVEADGFLAIYPGESTQPSVSFHTAPAPIASPVNSMPSVEPGFDWANASIGAALGAVAGLIVAALLMGRRRGPLADG